MGWSAGEGYVTFFFLPHVSTAKTKVTSLLAAINLQPLPLHCALSSHRVSIGQLCLCPDPLTYNYALKTLGAVCAR